MFAFLFPKGLNPYHLLTVFIVLTRNGSCHLPLDQLLNKCGSFCFEYLIQQL